MAVKKSKVVTGKAEEVEAWLPADPRCPAGGLILEIAGQMPPEAIAAAD